MKTLTTLVLIASFQENLGRPVPWQTILYRAAARDDGSGGGNNCNSVTCKAPVK